MKKVINWFRNSYVISKLRIKTGDVLLVKFKNCHNVDSNIIVFRNLLIALEKRNIRGVHIVFLDNGCELQGLSEDQMNRFGWFRKNGNPCYQERLLNAYREKRRWDGVNGRPFDARRFSEAEKCIARLEGK